MILLDSTACIDYLNGKEGIKVVLESLDPFYIITAISVYEVGIGLERTRRKKSEEIYQEMNAKWMEFLASIQILTISTKEAERAAKIYDDLETRGERIDDNDILIAGAMLSNGITKIVTRNVQHFNRIKELEIIEYNI